ncbi:MAG: aminopeptidase P N-terminal domain-containing protein, partial [Bacteroidia bacterium]
MRYHPLPSAMFIDHRNFFKSQLEGQSLAVFVSNDQMPTNADGSMGFKQNSDLFYLCGIDQEETLLVVFS